MSIDLKLPSYVDLLPDNFKSKSSQTNITISAGGVDTSLAGYKINPMLLTAWLLDVANGNYKFFNQSSMENFRRTRRMNDILFQRDVKMSSPEVYKGYLSFKGTWKDLLYVARLLGLKVEFEEYNHSGIIGSVIDIRKFAQSETKGLYLFNNTPLDPDFGLSNPTNSVRYNDKSKDSASQFKFTNPTNTVKYGQRFEDQTQEDRLCGFQITIDLNSSSTIDTMDILTKLSMMLINRLIPCARASIIYGNFQIDDIWDWAGQDKIDEGELGVAFADDIREDWVIAWKISHIADGETPPILLDGSKYIANRIMKERAFIQQ